MIGEFTFALWFFLLLASATNLLPRISPRPRICSRFGEAFIFIVDVIDDET